MTAPPLAVAEPADARFPDAESRDWVRSLSGTGPERESSIKSLHALLLRIAGFEISRRSAIHGNTSGDEDLAMQAADDALVAILSKLHTYRGDSRFTTWAYKFALLEAAVTMRRRSWGEREVPVETDHLVPLLEDERSSPPRQAEAGQVIHVLRDAIAEVLTPQQRDVLVAITLNDVPIDVLADRRNTTRGALYKTLHDARRKLRTELETKEIPCSIAY